MRWWNNFLANTWWGRISAELATIQHQNKLLLEGQNVMDERIQKLQEDFDAYKAANDVAYAGWQAYKQSMDDFKATVDQQVAAAVAADDADEDVDIKALGDAIAAAGQSIVAPPEMPAVPEVPPA